MNEKELEDDLKGYQNRVRHLETLIDGLQSIRTNNANCHFKMNIDKPHIFNCLKNDGRV